MEDQSEEIRHLRGFNNDLVSLLALPAMNCAAIPIGLLEGDGKLHRTRRHPLTRREACCAAGRIEARWRRRGNGRDDAGRCRATAHPPHAEQIQLIGGLSGAAAKLGMKRTTLLSRMQKLGIARSRQ